MEASGEESESEYDSESSSEDFEKVNVEDKEVK